MAIPQQPPSRKQSSFGRQNADYIEEMYEQWLEDPSSLTESWRMFFEGFELASCPRNCVSADQAKKQSQVDSLMYAYRSRGHLLANTDPLGTSPTSLPELELAAFGLEEADLDTVYDTGHWGGQESATHRAPLREIITTLRGAYCRSVGVEYLHIQDVDVRRWLQAEMEPILNRPTFDREKQTEILKRLIDSELFETFIFRHYPGQKRFSLEGAETLIAAIHAVVEIAPEVGVDEIVMGMSHRGRLNVLANILDKSYAMLFSEFDDAVAPNSYGGDGDVKYHKGYSSDHLNEHGHNVHVSLTANPSHLEAVDPVVEGRARAKQRRRDDTDKRSSVLPFLVHGDAAFAGQGLVGETLNLSQLQGYRTGGTVHFIVNNQIGFTTSPQEGRSTHYPTDIAKMVEAPIFHVNGDDPEAVVHVTELALRFRQEFARDVVVDMVCYRRHGHNEADEPAFTQPIMYRSIRSRPSVRKLYTEHLQDEGRLTRDDVAAIEDEIRRRLTVAYDQVKSGRPEVALQAFAKQWEGLKNPYSHDPVETGVPRETLIEISRALSAPLEDFSLHRKIARQVAERIEIAEAGGDVDWAFGEALAFGSLVTDGVGVRLSGQDCERGTFSQRHAVWRDSETQQPYAPLSHLNESQGDFAVYNSLLSEAAVLGFDYGYSLEEPGALVLWEAQFGDFANGAQVIIDQFIVSSQSKWQRSSGLVMLLPHGYEGQGPEHSNAYLERYLMACAEDNIQVCNLTTPAQYFHVLRRQVKRPFRRPLIIMTPKSLLRHPQCVSPFADFENGQFHEILDDPNPPEEAKRVLFCGGKVYYDLLERREADGVDGVAIIRVEQFYPFPNEQIRPFVERYMDVEDVAWVQEETENRGGWTFMYPILQRLFSRSHIRYVGRSRSASPATGSLRVHRDNQERIAREAVHGRDGGIEDCE